SPDLVILDLQIGNMGGVATCLAIRNEEGAGRVDPQNVLLLLDRIADVFIAKSADADGWIVKPLNPLRLQRAATLVMNGEYYTEHLTELAKDDGSDDEPEELVEASGEGDEPADAAVEGSEGAEVADAAGDSPAEAEAVS
ncbi:MAG TPA: hypothetical protein VL068_10340, partial [Microthrixaceae bacterium]|nr:hypothetical protein [Microthrixaceae bacterium]